MKQPRMITIACVVCWLAVPTFAQDARVQQPATPSTANADDISKSGTMKLTLKQGLKLEGVPVDLENVKVNTLFGEASIPIHTIAGIRFAQAPDEQNTVVLMNGDALTGELSLTEVKFASEWGEAKVHAAYLVSIVFRPDFAWSEVSTPSGKRWRLTKVQEDPGANPYPGTRVYNPRPSR